ncbi:unnamed protein product [Tenebrio molitor]|nr:unnamed protein product [Tenebrio molitor]
MLVRNSINTEMKNQPVKQLLSDDIVTVFQVDNKRQFIYVQKTEMMRDF